MHDIPEAELKTYETEDESGNQVFLPVLNDDGMTPCMKSPEACPKGSPENDSLYRMSARNRRCLKMFETIQASGGAIRLPVHLADDPEFWENMRIVDLAIKVGESRLRAAAYEEAQREKPDRP